MLVGRKKREEERERKREKASQTKEEKGEKKGKNFHLSLFDEAISWIDR